MLGENTLPSLYLKAEITGAQRIDDDVLISLSDGRTFLVPLAFLGHFDSEYPLPTDAQLIILRRRPRIEHIFIDNEALHVHLVDGRELKAPLAWFPRLVLGSLAERNHYQLRDDGQAIHWPDLDEDIDLEGLLVGGPSAESAASIRRWLAERCKSETNSNG
jgi:hypothetical protein